MNRVKHQILFIIFILGIAHLGRSQNYSKVGLYDFLIDNSIVIDTVTGVLIDQQDIFELFVREWTDDPDSHYREILIDMFKKVTDGYAYNFQQEKTILRRDTDPRSINRDFSELIPYYIAQGQKRDNTRDTVYLWSRPRYYNPDEPKLYEYSQLDPGSFQLSSVTVKDTSQRLPSCYLMQSLEILPNSYLMLHYGDGYKLECNDLNSEFYVNVYEANEKANSIRIISRGLTQYLLIDDYIYLFTMERDFITRLEIETSDSKIVLKDNNLVRYEYTLSD